MSATVSRTASNPRRLHIAPFESERRGGSYRTCAGVALSRAMDTEIGNRPIARLRRDRPEAGLQAAFASGS